MRRLAALATLGALVLGGSAQAQSAVLRAVVDSDRLTFTDAGGTAVVRLDPGSYSIEVDDRSPVHNVHLEGPGVSLDSGLAFTGSTTWTAELREGFYSVVSDPQADTLNRSFVAGAPPAPSLLARVTDTTISLSTTAGAAVTQLEPGTYAVNVEDASASESFRLVGPGVERHTQRHTRLGATWLVELREGVYHYFSDRSRTRLAGSFRVGAGAPLPATTTLRAITGSDFAIALVDEDSAPASRLEQGTYTIAVTDRSPDHNFRLSGPGVNVATTLPETGPRSFTVRLTGGTYSFLCDPHTQTMFGTVTVPRPASTARRLEATVAADGRAGLRRPGGTPVRSVPSGRYRIVVRDRSARLGFRLTGPGVRRATGAAFRGTVTWTVQLRRGTYRYGAGVVSRSFRVR